MITNIGGGYIAVDANRILINRVYVDRNGVFNNVDLNEDVLILIRDKINQFNEIMDGNLRVISNESECNLDSVVNTDLSNGLTLEKRNYNLSTQSAAKFILEKLKCAKCYYIGTEFVKKDIEAMGLEVIDISVDLNMSSLEKDIPVLFARPNYAIKSRYKTDEDIKNNIGNDISFNNLLYVVKSIKPKIVFCHTKPNCIRNEKGIFFRELNLGFYFNLLTEIYGYKKGKDIFDLGKGGDGSFFDMSLNIKHLGQYRNTIGIGDMPTDIEYVLKKGGTGILVNSGDFIASKEVLNRLNSYKGQFFNILDLSYLRFI